MNRRQFMLSTLAGATAPIVTPLMANEQSVHWGLFDDPSKKLHLCQEIIEANARFTNDRRKVNCAKCLMHLRQERQVLDKTAWVIPNG